MGVLARMQEKEGRTQSLTYCASLVIEGIIYGNRMRYCLQSSDFDDVVV